MAILIFLLSFIPLYWAFKIAQHSIRSNDCVWVLAVVYIGGIGLILFIIPILVWLKILPFYAAP